MSGDYYGILNELDKDHNPEEVADTSGNLPDASYQARLDKIYLGSYSEKLKTVMEFEILNGNYAFRKIFKFCNMETIQNLDYLTMDLRKLGIDKFKWATLESHFPSVLDGIFEINLKSKNGFQNVFIQKRLNMDENMAVPRSDADLGDVPF